MSPIPPLSCCGCDGDVQITTGGPIGGAPAPSALNAGTIYIDNTDPLNPIPYLSTGTAYVPLGGGGGGGGAAYYGFVASVTDPGANEIMTVGLDGPSTLLSLTVTNPSATLPMAVVVTGSAPAVGFSPSSVDPATSLTEAYQDMSWTNPANSTDFTSAFSFSQAVYPPATGYQIQAIAPAASTSLTDVIAPGGESYYGLTVTSGVFDGQRGTPNTWFAAQFSQITLNAVGVPIEP